MLSSSDAKWRCMWHMFVWSLLLTLASQYLYIVDHIALYIFASLCILVLPVFTAIYSNTSGRHGANLIRVAYVICDPVLACIAITPVLILNHLPTIVSQYNCIVKYELWNDTCECMSNRTINHADIPMFAHGTEISTTEKEEIISKVVARFVAIQMSVAMPILLSLLMGRRTSKMGRNTYILTFAYWFVTAIELVDLIETVRLGDIYKDVIYTTEVIISITMIITNSYAVVTLCSFISPRTTHGQKQSSASFDLIYKIFVGASGVLFTEIPLIVARLQLLVADLSRILPATFYLWCIKDCLFVCLIVFFVLSQKFGKKSVITKLPCSIKFDNTDIIFQPEKRDEYIVSKKRVTFQDPPATTFGEMRMKTIASCSNTAQALTGSTGVASKVPSSVLKNVSQTYPDNPDVRPRLGRPDLNISGQLTDLSKKTQSPSSSLSEDLNIRANISSDSSSGIYSSVSPDHPSMSSSVSSLTKLGIGARPKVHSSAHVYPTDMIIQEIKSRPGDGSQVSEESDDF